METRDDDSVRTRRRGSPGKIFVGGLPRETTRVQFFKHFQKYGEIKDSVIMLDPRTGMPRGFGFVTYENPSVIDKVIEDTHVVNGKQVVIKRTIPKGVVGTKDFRTRRTFISGIPSRLPEDEFKELFTQFGVVKEHCIVRDNDASFCGFGFITFDTEQAVDDLLAKGNKVELVGGSQILLHKVYARWELPPRGFFKLNSDGSSAANPEKAGAGGVIRNDRGQWIVGYSRKLGQATSTCAELWGVRDGLQLAVKQRLLDVIIEVDSQVVLDLICKEAVDSRTLSPIIKECRSLLEQIPNHRLCQIKRESNSCADHLARIGATMTKDFVIYDFPPDCVKLLVFAESLEPEDNELICEGETNEFESLNHRKDHNSLPQTKCGASPGKIFVGGLARDTTCVQLFEHFGQHGEIADFVIMKKKETGQCSGFGFVTYADPSVVDKVMKDTHFINGKQVEIKRAIPKGAIGTKDFKTKKIFVGRIPSKVSEDEFKDFFSQFGQVNEHQIMQDHATGSSCGFGYITFDIEQAVDDLLAKGNNVELAGSQVEIKRVSELHGDSRNACDGFEDFHGGCVDDRFDNISYRSGGSAPYWGGAAGHAEYDGSEFGEYRGYGMYGEDPFLEYSGLYGGGEFGHYGEYGSGMEQYRRELSLQYSSHHECYGDLMEPHRGEPFLEYSHHHEGEFGWYGEHGSGMDRYSRGEPSLRYSGDLGVGEFGPMEPHRGEPFLEYPRHHGEGEFGWYGEHGSGMEWYRGEPSPLYSGHHGVGEFGRFKFHGDVSDRCGREEFGGGMEPCRGEPPIYWRHVEGSQFGGYGGAMELRGKESFDEQWSLSRGGFDRGYGIYGEYGGGYRGGGGGGGAFFRPRGGHVGWYHPYAR